MRCAVQRADVSADSGGIVDLNIELKGGVLSVAFDGLGARVIAGCRDRHGVCMHAAYVPCCMIVALDASHAVRSALLFRFASSVCAMHDRRLFVIDAKTGAVLQQIVAQVRSRPPFRALSYLTPSGFGPRSPHRPLAPRTALALLRPLLPFPLAFVSARAAVSDSDSAFHAPPAQLWSVKTWFAARSALMAATRANVCRAGVFVRWRSTGSAGASDIVVAPLL